ncbi:MAG: AzlC family ABC transporter permease [Okeania sp. SIO3B3]|nr:AzlC family ABC transporter permease [Okeania sp. SIO3B3]
MKDALPILLGVVPFGLISGVLAVDVGLSTAQALGMSVIVFAGASQLAALQLIAEGAAIPVTLLTIYVINMRFVMYSASIGPYMAYLSNMWKALISYLLVDQAYGLSIVRYGQNPDMPHKHWYYLGTAVTMWVVWQITTLLGIFLGTQIPPEWGLDFAIPLMFIALAFPAITDRASGTTAIAGSVIAVVAAGLPLNLGLITGALCGIVAGMIVETWTKGELA